MSGQDARVATLIAPLRVDLQHEPGREQLRGKAEAYTDTAKRREKIREAPKSAASMTELQTTAQPY